MIDNDSLRQALGTLERHAPAEADVLAGMRAGIARRRRRRQVASVAGVAGAASAVALGVVLVAPGRGNDQGGAPPPVAVPPPTSSPVKVAKPLAPPVLPFSIGWVPDGFTNSGWDVNPNGGSVQYTGTKDFQNVVIWVSTSPRDPIEGAVEEPTQVGGRPGVIRRFSPGLLETQFIWQLADGRWAMVGGRAPTMSLATLRKVAESVTVEPSPPFTVSLGLRTVPERYAQVSWSGGGTMGGGANLCVEYVEPRINVPASDCIGVSLQRGTAPPATARKLPGGTGKASDIVEIPVDQEKTVNGVSTRATADGTIVYAQVDAEHWAYVSSETAGVDLLREVASNVTAQ